MTAIEQLVQRAARLGGSRVPGPPRLRLAIVTCMDSRIDPFQIFGLERGDAHVLRNAGGVVTDDVLRSLILSQRFLGTQEVMLIHHTRCGAYNLPEEQVKAELQARDRDAAPLRPGGLRRPRRRRPAVDPAGSAVPVPQASRRRPGFVLDIDNGSLREIR